MGIVFIIFAEKGKLCDFIAFQFLSGALGVLMGVPMCESHYALRNLISRVFIAFYHFASFYKNLLFGITDIFHLFFKHLENFSRLRAFFMLFDVFWCML